MNTTKTTLSPASLAAQNLSFEFNNISDDQYESVIFITSDPAKNICRFEVSTEEKVTFTTSAEIALTFKTLIGDAAIEEGLEVSSSDSKWKTAFVKSGQFRYWSLTPLQSVDLEPGQRLLFGVENLTLKPDIQEGQYPLNIEWGLSGIEAQQNIMVLRSKPGGGSTIMRAVSFGCYELEGHNVEENAYPVTIPFKGDDEIFANSIPELVLTSSIGLSISNSNPDEPIPWKDNCRFQVSFRTGDGVQSLVPLDVDGRKSFTAITLEFRGSSAGTPWTVTSAGGGGVSYWELKPAVTMPNFFEKGEVISFVLGGVRGNQVAGTSAIEISYLDFPGYRNGTIPVWIHKLEPTSFLDAACASYFIGPGGTEISWSTLATKELSLEIYTQHQNGMSSVPLLPHGAKYNLPPETAVSNKILTLRMRGYDGASRHRYLSTARNVGLWGMPKEYHRDKMSIAMSYYGMTLEISLVYQIQGNKEYFELLLFPSNPDTVPGPDSNTRRWSCFLQVVARKQLSDGIVEVECLHGYDLVSPARDRYYTYYRLEPIDHSTYGLTVTRKPHDASQGIPVFSSQAALTFWEVGANGGTGWGPGVPECTGNFWRFKTL